MPETARIMAALGPKMLDLARDRAAGAFPVLVTPGYTASARSRLGDDTTLAVEQLVVVETDPQRARAIARGPLGFLGKVPAYQGPCPITRMCAFSSLRDYASTVAVEKPYEASGVLRR